MGLSRLSELGYDCAVGCDSGEAAFHNFVAHKIILAAEDGRTSAPQVF